MSDFDILIITCGVTCCVFMSALAYEGYLDYKLRMKQLEVKKSKMEVEK